MNDDDGMVNMPVGGKVFIRGDIFHYLGRVKEVTGHAVVLEEASWLAEGDFFGKFLREGSISEVEPFPDVCNVSRSAIQRCGRQCETYRPPLRRLRTRLARPDPLSGPRARPER